MTGQTQRDAEPFSEEARKFTKFHLNQRNVEVVIEGTILFTYITYN